jgi:hypothetical protein
MTDKELVNYFKEAVIYWYEKIFVKHSSKDVQKDDKQFPQLKLLYKFYKGQD